MSVTNRADVVKTIDELLDELRNNPHAWENPTL